MRGRACLPLPTDSFGISPLTPPAISAPLALLVRSSNASLPPVYLSLRPSFPCRVRQGSRSPPTSDPSYFLALIFFFANHRRRCCCRRWSSVDRAMTRMCRMRMLCWRWTPVSAAAAVAVDDEQREKLDSRRRRTHPPLVPTL